MANNQRNRKRRMRYVPHHDNKSKYHPQDYFGVDNMEALHWGKLFVSMYGSIFSTYTVNHTIETDKMITHLVESRALKNEQIIRIERSKKECFTEVDPGHSEVLLILRDEFCVAVYGNGLYILYGPSINSEEVMAIAELAEKFKVERERDQNRSFYMIGRSDRGGLTLMDFNVKKYDIDIESNYNNDFPAIHETITKSLSDKGTNGLILLHGCYGSGKTYYIRHLIGSMNKKFIYLPLHMAEYLSSPDFLPFITEHSDSVLILEDCENYLMPRKDGNYHASALSNLLNLGDGLLSDALSINVICTFNANHKKIDEALLRKGRLIARYEFKELSVDKAQNLSNKLGKNVTITQPMSLAGIYNIEKNDYELKKTREIGFAISNRTTA